MTRAATHTNLKEEGKMFVGRKKELAQLERCYKEEGQKLVAVYGRRRIGKTVLLEEFMKDKTGISFTAFRGNKELLFKSLCDIVNSFFVSSSPRYAFSDLNELFSFIFNMSVERKFIFIIDEFGYLKDEFPEVTSLLQYYVDFYKNKGKLLLILCSSSRSFMENEVFGSASPLYGRRDLSLKIKPFGISETKEMLPLLKSSSDIFKVWAITGGIPLYLSLFAPYSDVDEAVKTLFFNETGYFVNEVDLIMLTEATRSDKTSQVCTLIACGTNKLSVIADKTGSYPTLIKSVLENLEKLDIVEKELSVSPAKRKPIWKIKDPLIKFWYTFRYPLSCYTPETMMNYYKSNISSFLGSSFEALCTLALPCILEGKPIVEYGRWWGGNPATKKEEEIDIVVRTLDNELIACECKYHDTDIRNEVVYTLQRRTALITRDEKVSYIVFTKNRTELDASSFPRTKFYSLEDVMLMLTLTFSSLSYPSVSAASESSL